MSDPRTLAPGRAQYSLMCAADGGIIDDLIVHRTAPTGSWVPNASNAATVADELRVRAQGFETQVDDASGRTALIAVQATGARAPRAARGRAHRRAAVLRRRGRARRGPARLGRADRYTGEDGFELFLANDDAVEVWRAILAAAPDGAPPIGLGARDTLRLEAGMPLYGNELGRDTCSEEARLGRVVRLDKPGGFVGCEALSAAHEAGPGRSLVGLVMRSRASRVTVIPSVG
ncbi:MAG: hypothetical protein R3C32_09035 [Chloroflexota bacterium]